MAKHARKCWCSFRSQYPIAAAGSPFRTLPVAPSNRHRRSNIPLARCACVTPSTTRIRPPQRSQSRTSGSEVHAGNLAYLTTRGSPRRRIRLLCFLFPPLQFTEVAAIYEVAVLLSRTLRRGTDCLLNNRRFSAKVTVRRNPYFQRYLLARCSCSRATPQKASG